MANVAAVNGGVNNQHTSASLYVGDLAQDVTEALLFEIFNAVGPVASIRVCRDAVTRRSLGYAYVNFHSVMDAERALDTMNFINIRGKPCRIMWSQRDPSLRKSGVGNVFVKNLDKSIDHKTLYDTFSMFGNILSCKVATDENGESRGYGFVHYTEEAFATKAIQKVDGMVIAEKKVTVTQFVPREQRQTGARKFTNVYIQRFPKAWSIEQLTKFMSEAGQIDSLHIAKDEEGKSLGFGFCNYPNAEDAAKAVEMFDGKEVDGEKLYVGRAMKKAEREKFLKDKYERMKIERAKKYSGVNLYVKHLDDSIDDERLRKEFEKFGNITSAKVMREPSGRSKGFGFVCFESTEQSTRAMAEMNSKIVEGKPLYVALAQRKEVRRQNLEKEFHERRSNQNPKNPGRGQGGPPGRGRGFRGQQRPNAYPAQNYLPFNPQQRVPPHQQMMFQRQPMNQFMRPSNPMMPGGMGRQVPPYNVHGMPMVGGLQRRQNRSNMPNIQQNRPAGAARAQQQQAPTPARQIDHNTPLTSEMLSAANPSQQKQMIGERIFPRIQHREPKLAGKITGMLLEMDNMELLHLLDDETALMDKINEALAVLNQHISPNEQSAQAQE